MRKPNEGENPYAILFEPFLIIYLIVLSATNLLITIFAFSGHSIYFIISLTIALTIVGLVYYLQRLRRNWLIAIVVLLAFFASNILLSVILSYLAGTSFIMPELKAFIFSFPIGYLFAYLFFIVFIVCKATMSVTRFLDRGTKEHEIKGVMQPTSIFHMLVRMLILFGIVYYLMHLIYFPDFNQIKTLVMLSFLWETLSLLFAKNNLMLARRKPKDIHTNE